jgi:hypothetical protein
LRRARRWMHHISRQVLVDCFATDHDADVAAAMQSAEVRPAARARFTPHHVQCGVALVMGRSLLPLHRRRLCSWPPRSKLLCASACARIALPASHSSDICSTCNTSAVSSLHRFWMNCQVTCDLWSAWSTSRPLWREELVLRNVELFFCRCSQAVLVFYQLRCFLKSSVKGGGSSSISSCSYRVKSLAVPRSPIAA